MLYVCVWVVTKTELIVPGPNHSPKSFPNLDFPSATMRWMEYGYRDESTSRNHDMTARRVVASPALSPHSFSKA